jgi:hypothetical protein
MQGMLHNSVPITRRNDRTIDSRRSDPDGIISGVSGILQASARENNSVHNHIMRVASAVNRKAKREAEIAAVVDGNKSHRIMGHQSYSSPHKSITSNDMVSRLRSLRHHESCAKSQISLTNQR